jgi:hypothetical protein
LLLQVDDLLVAKKVNAGEDDVILRQIGVVNLPGYYMGAKGGGG